jgi:methylenetetrahydrofolate dehydrogenase (NADP+)/methenyltetrahydrofolate cyclohydrolase
MKLLLGQELAGYIKERQANTIRALASEGILPRLSIIKTIDNPVIDLYVRLKKQYAQDIGALVDINNIAQEAAPDMLKRLNEDKEIHGIIIQLPLQDPSKTDELVNLVSPQKDVDALGKGSLFEPATPMAILWLLSGFNIDLSGKKVVLIGRGKLVGGPLEKILNASGVDVLVVDRATTDIAAMTRSADIIITATGKPAILTSDMIKPGAVVVDAGVASENGKTVGDVDTQVFEREDITITPQKGGVGPLTICALFENVIRAAENSRKN